MTTILRAAAAAALLVVLPASADTPRFDRPGISFSTDTLPPGSFSLEQGLPDVERDSADGERATSYSASTRLRVGLAERFELQVATALAHVLRTRDASGARSTRHGIGDLGIAVKVAVPSRRERYSLALLAGVTLPSGDDDFSAGVPVWSLGGTESYALSDTRSLSLYLDVDRSDGANSYTASPSFSLALGERLGAYVEAGVTHARGANDWVGGGGVTWMLLDNVQLDAYADAGLTSRSTDLLAGCGVSAYFE